METLKAHIKKYKLSLGMVAEMTGIPKRTVRSHVHGERNIGPVSAIKYSQGLGLSIEKLIEDRQHD